MQQPLQGHDTTAAAVWRNRELKHSQRCLELASITVHYFTFLHVRLGLYGQIAQTELEHKKQRTLIDSYR
jgi:hypothetical protein